MKPTPQARHLAAILIFAGTSIVFGYLAMHDQRPDESQLHLGTAALKDSYDELYPHDPIYGPSGLWQLETPIFQGLLKLTLVPTGYRHILLPFRLMSGLAAMVYLCGMYALLYRQCRSWSISAYVSVVSVVVTETIPRLWWGFGSLGVTTPSALCLALVPLVVLAFLRYEHQWRLVLVFGCIGLLANLHLATAMNLTLVLLATYLARRRFALRSWSVALAGGAAALVCAMPYLAYVIGLRLGREGSAAAMAGGYDVAMEALALADLKIFYPDVLKGLLHWRPLGIVVALGIPSLLVLTRVERYRVRHREVWIWLIISSLLVAFGLHGLSQAVGKWLDQPPPVMDFLHAARLMMLPLFVLLAQALTNVFRLARGHRAVLQWLCVAGLVAWIVPSPNVRVARYAAMETATMFIDEPYKPHSVLRHRKRDQQRRELKAIAEWARRESDPGAVFITDNISFRLYSRRSIVTSQHDLTYVYYLAPQRLTAWMTTVAKQAGVLYPPAGRADADSINRFVADLAARLPYQDATGWYIIYDHTVALEDRGGLERLTPHGWGKWYQLCAIRQPKKP